MFEKVAVELAEMVSLRGLNFGIVGLVVMLILLALADFFPMGCMFNQSESIAIIVFFFISACIGFVGASEAVAFFAGGLVGIVLAWLLRCLLSAIEDLLCTIANWWRNRKDKEDKNHEQ